MWSIGIYSNALQFLLPVSELRVVEVLRVMEGSRGLELLEFMGQVGNQLDHTKETLTTWFTQIQTVFYKVSRGS